MLGHRSFLRALSVSLLTAPLAAEAQQAGRVWRIGWLGNGTRASREANTLTPLREGLRELGYDGPTEATNVWRGTRTSSCVSRWT